MSSVWDMILQWGSTIKVSIELPVATRHRRDMTEKLLKATLNPNSHTHTQNLNLNYLLATRQNGNHSPGPWPGRLVPSSPQSSELGNSILDLFSRRDKRVWKCIPIRNGLVSSICPIVYFMFRLWFLNVRVNLFFTSSYEGVFKEYRIRMPGGQVKPIIITVLVCITVFDKQLIRICLLDSKRNITLPVIALSKQKLFSLQN